MTEWIYWEAMKPLKKKSNTKTILIIVLLVFLFIIAFRDNFQHFETLGSLITSNMPYTSGASLRSSSINSATNR
jgi:hypothetical protein